jgi:hypothetical protein
MVTWYQDVFEASVVHRDPALAFLTYDDENHRFAFANLETCARSLSMAREEQKSESTTCPILTQTPAICSTSTRSCAARV